MRIFTRAALLTWWFRAQRCIKEKIFMDGACLEKMNVDDFLLILIVSLMILYFLVGNFEIFGLFCPLTFQF